MKIDQRTLRRLRKAGFPLKDVAQELSDLGIIVPIPQFKKVFPNSISCDGKLYLPPTLDAAFNAIKHKKYFSLIGTPKEFTAEVTGAKATGKTPLEALLTLFLKLK